MSEDGGMHDVSMGILGACAVCHMCQCSVQSEDVVVDLFFLGMPNASAVRSHLGSEPQAAFILLAPAEVDSMANAETCKYKTHRMAQDSISIGAG